MASRRKLGTDCSCLPYAPPWARLLLVVFIGGRAVMPQTDGHVATPQAAVTAETNDTRAYQTDPILVAYAYWEKDSIQIDNFKFFIAAGMISPPNQEVHWCLTISHSNTSSCQPCQALQPLLTPPQPGPPGHNISSVQTGPNLTLLLRSDNEGMDIGSHNVTLEYMLAHNKLWFYKFFVFINSSTKGPFFPAYMPSSWHWTHAYLARMVGDIHAVCSSLTCLPAADLGGPGPRMESWAYAVDTLGLKVMLEYDVLDIRTCKVCVEGIVVDGEYRLTWAMLDVGFNVATLLSMYREGVDWRNESHWNCNNNIHPSRHGTYDHIEMHPYETVFVKSSWHVADHYTSHYAKWRLAHLAGSDGAEGQFDAAMYLYGITLEAQEPGVSEQVFDVTKFRAFFKAPGVAEQAAARFEWNKALIKGGKRLYGSHARRQRPQ